MAVVKFSASLRDDILSNATRLFRERIEQAEKDFDPTWGDRVAAVVFQPFMSTINKLPREWFAWTNEVRSNVIAGVKLDEAIKFNLTQEIPVPKGNLSTAGIAPISFDHSGYYHSSFNTDEAEGLEDIRTEVVAYKNKITLLKEKRDQFRNGVSEVIHAHNTLAPALKAWPPLMDLLPDHVKARHFEKIERGPKVDPQLTTNLNALTATIVANKIGG